jgi:hypothetical protein
MTNNGTGQEELNYLVAAFHTPTKRKKMTVAKTIHVVERALVYMDREFNSVHGAAARFADYLGLNKRAARVFRNLSITSIGDLRDLSETKLLRQRGCGRATVTRIRERLSEHGIGLPTSRLLAEDKKYDRTVAKELEARLEEAHKNRAASEERMMLRYTRLRSKHIIARAKLHDDPDQRLVRIRELEELLERTTETSPPAAEQKLKDDIYELQTALERNQKLLAQALERQNSAPCSLDPLDQRYLDEACGEAITATHSSYRQVVGNLFWKKDLGI